MKQFFVSAGLVAVSAAALECALADDVTGPKYWSVSASLRGFWDDDYNITGTGRGSWGFEVLPSISIHVPGQQTDFGVRYTYGLYYYEDRQEIGVDAIDQTHELDLWLDHAFNDRWRASVNDSFAVGQEPELLNPNPVTGVATPYRINGDNLSNHGALQLNTEWTRLFSTSLTYNNGLYDYQNSGAYFDPNTEMLVNGPSYAGLLDRIEESVALDLKWQVLPETIAFVGYSFSWVNYTGGEPIAVVTLPNSITPFVYHSSDRDSLTHYAYVGVEEEFTPSLSASIRAGASYTDVYGDPLFPSTEWYPYADLSLTYTYMPGSYVQLGFTHAMSASDQVAPDAQGNITQYAENSVIYADINHRITQKLMASVIGRIQYSDYQGGQAASDSSTDYGVGVNLTYQINAHFEVDAGYNFDQVVSDINNYSYSRNRVYLGMTATY